jgi:ATP-dependent Clp endopeptidase proteolytic subunit ClpP
MGNASRFVQRGQPQRLWARRQRLPALLQNRIIFLGSEVKDENANAICAQMLLLNAEDPHKDVYLYINSPGGSVDSGMAIYDTMKWISNDVATVPSDWLPRWASSCCAQAPRASGTPCRTAGS